MADNEAPTTSESLASFTTVSSEGEDSGGEASESSSRSCAEPEGMLSRLKAVFPFLNNPTILSQLKAELPEYLVKAEDLSADMTPLEWWKGQEHNLPTWFASVKKIVLIQPSSTAAERVFSLLKASFNEHQDKTISRHH